MVASFALFMRDKAVSAVLASVLLTSGLVAGCKDPKAVAEEALTTNVALLKGTDFGPSWDGAMAALAALADPKAEVPAPQIVMVQAKFWRVRSQLALFITALVTESDELFAKWQTIRGWKLEGKLSDLVNFQSTVQEIAADFDKLLSEKGLTEAESAVVTLLAQFSRTTQGVFYRDKRQYLKGGAGLRKVPELAWMDDALALRDLIAETTRRPGPGMNANWQNTVLTVVGRICPEVASRHINGVCTMVDLSSAEEFCPADWEKQNKDQRIGGAVLLMTQCKSEDPGAETLRGMQAIRFYYDAAFDRLASSTDAPAPLVAWAKANRETMGTAYAALEKDLFMGMTQEDLRKVDERKMIESLAPRKKEAIPSLEGTRKAPSNRPKEAPLHMHGKESKGHEGHNH